jgi:hypothetical protein
MANRVFLNSEEITNFDNDTQTIEWVEMLLSGKTEFNYNDDEDHIDFEVSTDPGLITVDCSDLDENGKLTIFN